MLARHFIVLCMALAGLLAVDAATATGRAAGTSPVVSRLEGTVVWPAGMRPAPNFTLRDQDGKRISRRGLHGRVWAMTFLDSSCTKECPVEARALATVQKALGSRYHLTVVVVSVLPAYDTPTRVRAFAHKTGLAGDWHWLLGTYAQLAPVWRAYGIEVITGLIHTAALYLIDVRGNVRVADAVPFYPSQLEASVRALTVGHT